MRLFPLLRPIFAASLCAALALVVAPAARAQDPASKTPVAPHHDTDTRTNDGAAIADRIGSFLVGDQAPDLDLNDTVGKRFHLDDARRAGPWLLVFAHEPNDLDEARGALDGLTALGVSTVAIAPFHRDEAVPGEGALRLLPDHAGHVARTYGMLDPVTTNSRAGAFLVDTDGRMILIVSGGFPSSPDLVRMSKEALDVARKRR
jgi:peroxiredoxin